MDKIDMSLDDIIKLQRKERRKQKATTKKVTLATKPHRPVRGRKPPGRQGISPLNRSLTAIEPTSVINGQKSYSARYLKLRPGKGMATSKKNSFGGMRSDQIQVNGGASRPVRQRLKIKRAQNANSAVNRSLPTQQRFKQRRRANANPAATRTPNRQQKFNQRRPLKITNNRKKQQSQNQGQQIKATNNKFGQMKQQRQRFSQRQQQVKKQRTQAQSQTRKTRQIQQPRRQQQSAGTTKRSVGMLKVSISTTSNTQNGAVKLKRNTFYSNDTPNRPNNRASQAGRKQKQPTRMRGAERTVIL